MTLWTNPLKPFLHANISAKKHGGKPQDYQDIHDFIDSSKIAIPDVRHRAMLHSAWGCYLVERLFGPVRTNSDGRTYSPRDIAEEHIQQDLGFIPTLEDWLKEMPIKEWMSGTLKRTKVIDFD
jgi:hypothetical protein